MTTRLGPPNPDDERGRYVPPEVLGIDDRSAVERLIEALGLDGQSPNHAGYRDRLRAAVAQVEMTPTPATVARVVAAAASWTTGDPGDEVRLIGDLFHTFSDDPDGEDQ
jgi:hypothetical protein